MSCWSALVSMGIRIHHFRSRRIQIRGSYNKMVKFCSILRYFSFLHLSIGLHEGRPSYRRSLQPQKKTSGTSKLYISSIFEGQFLPTWTRIWIYPTNINGDPCDRIRIRSGSTPVVPHKIAFHPIPSTFHSFQHYYTRNAFFVAKNTTTFWVEVDNRWVRNQLMRMSCTLL